MFVTYLCFDCVRIPAFSGFCFLALFVADKAIIKQSNWKLAISDGQAADGQGKSRKRNQSGFNRGWRTPPAIVAHVGQNPSSQPNNARPAQRTAAGSLVIVARAGGGGRGKESLWRGRPVPAGCGGGGLADSHQGLTLGRFNHREFSACPFVEVK